MFWDWRSIPCPYIGLHIKYEPPTRPRALAKVCCGGWWWSKGILEFHFGPNLRLRLEAWTKLNNMGELAISEIIRKYLSDQFVEILHLNHMY